MTMSVVNICGFSSRVTSILTQQLKGLVSEGIGYGLALEDTTATDLRNAALCALLSEVVGGATRPPQQFLYFNRRQNL
ncbi:MAG: hypothetical protein VKL39_09970, partial [Leptolyngbyaceae bacterium]|nr:hypothetical protein [Leptolyngbyaceae bacterium]